MTSMGGPREPKPEPLALAEVQCSAHSARFLVFLHRNLLLLKSSPSSEQSICLFSLVFNLTKSECDLALISAMTATVARADSTLNACSCRVFVCFAHQRLSRPLADIT